ncbi:MAG: hypothetical protein LBG58_12505 [Planctomycetaceae bacterium]|nr:hypothetical protein [Planctomycetaceae bacterium]
MAKKQSTNKSGKSQDYEDIFDYTSLQKQDNRYPLLLFIERIFDHRIFLCIILGAVSAIALLKMPATDIKEVILAILETIKSIKNGTLVLFSCLIILTLSFIVFYQYSRQKWEKEMQRVTAERDKLQEKLDCPIQSSEDLK